ncbi:hypothetical protein RAHE111665_17355 [Rariglobus hedericola]
MRSEFQFLQSEDDEREFITTFSGQVNALETDSETQWFFRVGDCPIQFLRSRRWPNQIAVGRIAIATHGFGLSFASSDRAEAIFKQMRTWLKKRYTNKLTAENTKIPGSTTSYRNMWLGPDARTKYRSTQVTLRSMVSDCVVIKEDAEPGATDNDLHCHGMCSEPHIPRQRRSRLT